MVDDISRMNDKCNIINMVISMAITQLQIKLPCYDSIVAIVINERAIGANSK
jgi:hypothetical protein